MSFPKLGANEPSDDGFELFDPDSRYVPVEYNNAMQEFIQKAESALLAADPLIGPMRGSKTVHGGSFRNAPGEEPVDHPLYAVQAPMQVHIGELRDGNVDAFISSLYDFAEMFQEEHARRLIGVVMDISEAVGNTTNVEGRPLTADDIIDMEESISASYDEDGNHELAIVCSPKTYEILKRVQWSPEQIKRQQEMRARKRADYLASKRTRRLRRSSLRA